MMVNAARLLVVFLYNFLVWRRIMATLGAVLVKIRGGDDGGHGRNRTGVHGFAGRCVTTPPRGPSISDAI